ncbi:Collagen alpha-1(XV) chain [Frankliniella fusca]|uniref:Collagen alpha-1(XV) chain n=1 Tax=Frankliniella fusca TaxID=407009 RepID=A0AAE1GT63_9NEOP|nr:Collagen alpha-1(XV) chain [Frankliniella fusca]
MQGAAAVPLPGFSIYWGHDILSAIQIPFVDPKTQYFDYAPDGFPAFGLLPGSDVKKPFRVHMPDKLYAEFSITAKIRSMSREGGFLFAVVNPLDTVVQLGLHLAPASAEAPGHTNVTLLYTDVSIHHSSQTIASFVVPSFTGRWGRLALAVTEASVTLYLDCEAVDTVLVDRVPRELVFDSASTLYVGQAGPIIKGFYNVSRTSTSSRSSYWGAERHGVKSTRGERDDQQQDLKS